MSPATVHVTNPRQHAKAGGQKKPRFTPKQCRKVTDNWKSHLGEDVTKELVEGYTDPTRLLSVKGSANRIRGNLAHLLHQEWSVPSAHSDTGGRRNPGRNDEFTWKGDSFICPDDDYIALDLCQIDPFDELCSACEEPSDQETRVTRPRSIEVSLAEFPVRISKPKRPVAHGYEFIPSAPPASSFLLPESEEPLADPDLETMSNFSWDAVTLNNPEDFSEEEDWEELIVPGPSSTIPTPRTYAQVLSKPQVERRE